MTEVQTAVQLAAETNRPKSMDADGRAGVQQVVARAQATGRTHWIARTIETELEDGLHRFAQAGTRDRFYWERVETGEMVCAWGAVGEVESTGRSRFEHVREWSEDVGQRLAWIGAVRPRSAPIFFGGFGFEDDTRASSEWKAFPAARFVLPEALIERRAGITHGVLIVRVEPGASVESVTSELKRRELGVSAARMGSGAENATATEGTAIAGPEFIVRGDRSHAVFKEQVRAIAREIEAGRLAKVVLARSLSVDHDGEIDVPDFLARLRSLYPSCTLIAVGRGHDTFVAATPERLLRVSGETVETAALAGSAPRGRLPEEDRALADSLLASEKEREEHAHVVDAIRVVLALHCDELELPDAPRLRRLHGIQHLETLIRGRLKSPCEDRSDILELVARLHPTPAVGGVPAAPAGAWLRRFENLDRGWYAAPVGWLDGEGGGDFNVALRSALIRNALRPTGESGASRSLLFAGAGIVAGSEPECELVETRIKLRALLAPLTEI
jgi:isochorismate synthase